MELNTIYNMDCVEGLREMENKSIDLVLTDPPYGIDLKPQRKTSKFKDEVISNDQNLDWLPNFVDVLKEKVKDDFVGYIFCNWQNYDIFKKEFEKKFIIKNLIVWDKMWFGMGNNWRPNHEFIMVICNKNFKTKSKNNENILRHRRIHPSKLSHSCEKPLSLLEKLINESSEKGDIVFDGFLGSGSTIEACLNTNRNYIGFELDENYYKVSLDRIKKHKEEMEK